jgi:hypothetical protein
MINLATHPITDQRKVGQSLDINLEHNVNLSDRTPKRIDHRAIELLNTIATGIPIMMYGQQHDRLVLTVKYSQ